MPVERFLDTNILLYGFDLDAPEKRAVAMSLLERAWTEPGSTAVSVQVLQEFYVNFTRKGYPDSEARLLIDDFCQWPVIDNSLTLLGHGLSIREMYRISLWDALIVAAADASGARELLTEDLNHGQLFENVRAINPFHKS